MMLAKHNPSLGGMKPTTDALKQATDRILKEQQEALQTAATYRLKLDESQAYLSRLEAAYQRVVQNNSGLRAKVAADQDLVKDLIRDVDLQSAGLQTLDGKVNELSTELRSGKSFLQFPSTLSCRIQFSYLLLAFLCLQWRFRGKSSPRAA